MFQYSIDSLASQTIHGSYRFIVSGALNWQDSLLRWSINCLACCGLIRKCSPSDLGFWTHIHQVYDGQLIPIAIISTVAYYIKHSEAVSIIIVSQLDL